MSGRAVVEAGGDLDFGAPNSETCVAAACGVFDRELTAAEVLTVILAESIAMGEELRWLSQG